MSTQEVAEKLANYCKQGQFSEAIDELYGADIVSIEPDGAPQKEVRGLEAVKEKTKNFNEMVEAVHGMEVSDPVVGDKFFAIAMKMDVTFKGAPRTAMEEVCLYKAENGKIVWEQFFFTPMNPGG